jgi:hypothetical protein
MWPAGEACVDCLAAKARFHGRKLRMRIRPIAAIASLFVAPIATRANAQGSPTQSPKPAKVQTTLVYQNKQYGFCFLLPESWKGYTIVGEQWSGTVLDTREQKSGPELLIRNPKWTAGDPYQDIPIMIFTPGEWKLVAAEKMGVSAAPIGPAELGHNKSYVFALPPRWIGFVDAKGIDEVQALMSQNPFQAPCGHKSTQPAQNLP